MDLMPGNSLRSQTSSELVGYAIPYAGTPPGHACAHCNHVTNIGNIQTKQMKRDASNESTIPTLDEYSGVPAVYVPALPLSLTGSVSG